MKIILASLLAVLAQGQHLRSNNSTAAARDLQGNVQYTRDQADWSGIYAKVDAVSSVTDHTPDGVGWIKPWKWGSWDGVPVDPSGYTRWGLYRKVCPSGNAIIGLKEKFYEHNPFADIQNPSKADVDEWNRIVINHIRDVFGFTNEAKPDMCWHARAQWSQERRNTDIWDTKYPENTCVGSSNPHCGDSWLPTDPADQAPYLPDGHPTCLKTSGSSGILYAKADIPWSIALSRVFCGTLAAEGFCGGHVGPFFRREWYGLSFWDMDPDNMLSMHVSFTGRWGGTLVAHHPMCDQDDPKEQP